MNLPKSSANQDIPGARRASPDLWDDVKAPDGMARVAGEAMAGGAPAILNPEYEKAPYGVWFPALEPRPW